MMNGPASSSPPRRETVLKRRREAGGNGLGRDLPGGVAHGDEKRVPPVAGIASRQVARNGGGLGPVELAVEEDTEPESDLVAVHR